MSAKEDLSELPGASWEQPTFELECLYDEMDDPDSVTIFFPRGPRTATEWVTSDLGTAVSLDNVR